MIILVACEESQAVTTELRALGHEAYSCDILECSGGHDEWHIKIDVLEIINGGGFETCDGEIHFIAKWDMIIAFPPCTHLAVSGARHFEKKRDDGRQLEGIEFFAKILNANCEKIAIENPVNIIGSDYIKQWFPDYGCLPNCTQYIQPYEYGDHARKKTCLWLKGLPKLKPTKIVEPTLATYICKNGKVKTFSADYGICKGSTMRSKTYPGIARAMAEQWGGYTIEC